MKEIYITDSEREKCRKVADAFAELYEVEYTCRGCGKIRFC